MHRLVAVLPFCIAGLQIFYYYSQLPETMAVHFGHDGQPNGWMNRDGFIAFYFGLLFIMSGIFCGMGALLPKLNPRFINIPNKDYWLTPERQETSLKSLRRGLTNLALFIAAFIIGMHQMLIDINITENPVLNEKAFLWAMALFLAVTAGFVFWTYRRFHRPEQRNIT